MRPEDVLTPEELTSLKLRSIYAEAGFSQYKMSKFEPYDLYATNKDFLESEQIVTFTDVSGRLMALKPDVTLSIIKNTELAPGQTRKLYYTEHVYRVPKGAPGFRELTQVGLECIGETDAENVRQVLTLACESLRAISGESVLDLSHLGLISDLLAEAGLSGAAAKAALGSLHEKNAHALAAVCEESGVAQALSEKLQTLVSVYGPPREALPRLKAVFGENAHLAALETITSALPEENVRIDFSVPANMKFYNGIVFKGYVKGVPSYVLSGGQYDHLMKRMKKSCRAIGFAVYMDMLQQLAVQGG